MTKGEAGPYLSTKPIRSSAAVDVGGPERAAHLEEVAEETLLVLVALEHAQPTREQRRVHAVQLAEVLRDRFVVHAHLPQLRGLVRERELVLRLLVGEPGLLLEPRLLRRHVDVRLSPLAEQPGEQPLRLALVT